VWFQKQLTASLYCNIQDLNLAQLAQTPQCAQVTTIAAENGHHSILLYALFKGLPLSEAVPLAALKAHSLKCLKISLFARAGNLPNYAISFAACHGFFDGVRYLHNRGSPLWGADDVKYADGLLLAGPHNGTWLYNACCRGRGEWGSSRLRDVMGEGGVVIPMLRDWGVEPGTFSRGVPRHLDYSWKHFLVQPREGVKREPYPARGEFFPSLGESWDVKSGGMADEVGFASYL
jgi:hypothetical protein